MGDPAGVGPEVILKALSHQAVGRACNPLILGDWGVLQRVRARSKRLPKLISWQSGVPLLPLLRGSGGFVVCPLSTLRQNESRPGRPVKAGGHAAYRYITVAARLALSNVADAIATAPISKSILIDAGYNYPGHTELLAELSRTSECRMMLIG
ncbi:MAG TPA: 4-hydroxythreonine-4-phosphate dehydrogenase PdxA, partial [Candidatus Binatia bacterium]